MQIVWEYMTFFSYPSRCVKNTLGSTLLLGGSLLHNKANYSEINPNLSDRFILYEHRLFPMGQVCLKKKKKGLRKRILDELQNMRH